MEEVANTSGLESQWVKMARKVKRPGLKIILRFQALLSPIENFPYLFLKPVINFYGRQIWLTKKRGAVDQKGLSKLLNSIFAFATCCFHDPHTINSPLVKIIED